jgi:hypothetical protein
MDNNTRALFIELIKANPGAPDEKLRKVFLKQIRASPMGHLFNPGKLVDDGMDWDAWRAAIRQVRKELESEAAQHDRLDKAPESKILPFPRRLGRGKWGQND